MKIQFFKYQGAGNDFVMIDQRQYNWLERKDTDIIQRLCDRRFGVGADGLILLQQCPGFDFEMIYFNADGRESSMCGNGGRCIAAFAHALGIVQSHCRFLAIDGAHEALIRQDGWIELKMSDVAGIEQGDHYYVLNTGSPHYVTFVPDVGAVSVFKEGRSIRYSDRFQEEGINVNFVEANGAGIEVATYERGVEDETLSCGTGVTASALAYALMYPEKGLSEVAILTKGGRLSVRFERAEGSHFNNIWLCGPAEYVYKGEVSV